MPTTSPPVNRLRRLFIRCATRVRRALGIGSPIPVVDTARLTEGYHAHQDNPPVDPCVKVLAYYLPQFHPFPQNDAWWGKGFTEWSNVGKAQPNYAGHYQPHCPIHLGYYDLRLIDNMIEQARLARNYGIYGFCYYFYWFNGTVLMHQPLEQMLADPRVDMPFCLMWANENWSRRWDGKDDDILIAQAHSRADSLAFIRHLGRYFQDDRYVRVNGLPVLIVYRANLIPDIAETGRLWREEALRLGLPGLYLVAAQSFDITSPAPFGFDAAVQFPPHPFRQYPDHQPEVTITNPAFTGRIHGYPDVAQRFVQRADEPYKVWRACMLSWDNTARKQDGATIFKDFSLQGYQQWLSHNLNVTAHDPRLNDDERLTFVNAWNEWAEGSHLEPDRRFGYGYLQATYDAVQDLDSRWGIVPGHPWARRHDVAVVLHLHYAEVVDPLLDQIDQAFPDGQVDLYVTTTASAHGARVRQRWPQAQVRLVENRGRDILPFVEAYRQIHALGHLAVCKVHTKRSAYRPDGERLRQGLLAPLLGSVATVQAALTRFRQDPKLGMLVPGPFLIPATRRNTSSNLANLDRLESLTGVPYGYTDLAAGTMFWFRPACLSPLLALKPQDFDLERGLADGTLTHAVERMMTSWARAEGYTVATC